MWLLAAAAKLMFGPAERIGCWKLRRPSADGSHLPRSSHASSAAALFAAVGVEWREARGSLHIDGVADDAAAEKWQVALVEFAFSERHASCRRRHRPPDVAAVDEQASPEMAVVAAVEAYAADGAAAAADAHADIRAAVLGLRRLQPQPLHDCRRVAAVARAKQLVVLAFDYKRVFRCGP